MQRLDRKLSTGLSTPKLGWNRYQTNFLLANKQKVTKLHNQIIMYVARQSQTHPIYPNN